MREENLFPWWWLLYDHFFLYVKASCAVWLVSWIWDQVHSLTLASKPDPHTWMRRRVWWTYMRRNLNSADFSGMNLIGWLPCITLFVPTQAWEIGLIQEPKRPSFRWAAGRLLREVFIFHYVRKSLLVTVVCDFLHNESHGGRQKSIFIVISTLKALRLDLV